MQSHAEDTAKSAVAVRSILARPAEIKLREPGKLEDTVRAWLDRPIKKFPLASASSGAIELEIVKWRAAKDNVDFGTFFLDEPTFEAFFDKTSEGFAAYGIGGDLELEGGEKYPLWLLLIRTAQETYSKTIRDTAYVRGSTWLSANCLFVHSGHKEFDATNPDFWSYKTISAARARTGAIALAQPVEFARVLCEFIRIHLSSYSWIEACKEIQNRQSNAPTNKIPEIVA